NPQAAAGQSKPTKTPDHPKPNGLPLCMNFPRTALPLAGRGDLPHVSFNPIRLKDKNMQQIKVLQRPLRV
ncbi:hypothetical protein, partial [Sinorhizobium meliloti]|uniref:hypothetical protein n=1 Tax=Rhizobium meliloti TaxID=382 RepID=UPI0012961E8F